MKAENIHKFPAAVRDAIHTQLIAEDARKRAQCNAVALTKPAEMPRGNELNRSKTLARTKAQASSKSESHLERKFALLWGAVAPELILVPEYPFALPRRWRADFFEQKSRTLFEIEGGAFTQGRHTRGKGFLADAEKYLQATLLGYTVIRLTAPQINAATLARIRDWIRQRL